ncbi:hypothetical protein TWF506_006118 [Arthrobotrys conoides]|uniref:Uncharacterized protein n=1 Tax=Arthrobotrys conoides TaxID=74498 RepID=A0AAN8PK51_9PEZI
MQKQAAGSKLQSAAQFQFQLKGLTKLDSLVAEKKKLPRFWETKGKRQTWRWTGGGGGGMSDGKNGCFRSQWKLAQS